MRALYIDNIRGFNETYIPIADINFLMGENSSGKTTILTIINLLTSTRFWFYQHFNTDEVELGSFSQIVNMNSLDKSQFRIGYIEDIVEQKDEKSIHAFLLTFVEEDGLPIISKYNFLSNDLEVRVIFSKRALSYRIIPVAENISEEAILKIFNGWTCQTHEDENNYNRLESKDIPLPRITSLPFITDFLVDKLKEKSKVTRNRGQFPLPSFAYDLAWIAPIRSKPKRTYDEYKLDFTPEGDHTPYLLRKLVNQRWRGSKKFLSYVEKVGKESGLFDSIKVKPFGKSSDSPFAIDVIIDNKELRLVNTGYGVSQALPVIVEIIARSKGAWFAIQQPEVHLHPRAQAALGDLFFQLASEESKRFLIETHSDFIIDRYRLNIQKKHKDIDFRSQILFFEKTLNGNIVNAININDDGEFSENQPKSFRDFFLREQIALLGL